ncbi:hypothetical protein WIW50_14885 [Flavobacteriaceae bacterium 3-367]
MAYFQKTFFLLGAILLLNNSLHAQEMFDGLTRKLCKCIEREKASNTEDIGFCFEKVMMNRLQEIKEYYDAQTMSEIDVEEMGNIIGAKMMKECDYFLEHFSSDIVGPEKTVKKQPDLRCDDLKNGEFYYLTTRPNTTVQDTTFVTISNGMYLERMRHGKTYSLLKIKWKDDCTFNLEFQESNDPFKKEVSQAGDIYEYEVLTNGKNSYILQLFWRKRNYQFELFRLK